jgi:uncharacterized membrane protein YhhN
MNFLEGGFVIAAAMAISYGGWLVWQEPSHLRTLVKTISIGSLSLLSFRLGGPMLLTVALGFSALGDAFLANKGERNFLFGLGAFLLAHLAYTGLFVASDDFGTGLSFNSHVAVAAVLIAISLLVVRNLWPHLGVMRIPVVCYVFAILAMGIAATGLMQLMVIVGALLFMLSDIILSHELFVWKEGSVQRQYSPYFIWGLYWGGQAMIAWAYLS